MSSEPEYGPITSFLLRLAEDEDLLCQWVLNRRKALAGQGLSSEDEELLVAGDFRAIRARIEEEHRGREPMPLMLMLMRA
jgi:hypothetical protein